MKYSLRMEVKGKGDAEVDVKVAGGKEYKKIGLSRKDALY